MSASIQTARASAENRLKFLEALDKYQLAALALSRAWEKLDEDVQDLAIDPDTYPDYLPSFDEHVVDVLGMETLL